MAETLAQKAAAIRERDVRVAETILKYCPTIFPEGSLGHEWARRVIENEQKAVAKAAEK